MDGVRGFLTRQIGPFPVYAYGVGLLAVGVGYWYFTRHNTGAATVAPQTNYPADDNQLPYPFPGGGQNVPAPVPPSSVFDTASAASGSTQGTGPAPNSPPPATSQPTSNFTPPPSEPTTSQTFAASVQQNPSMTNSPQPLGGDVPAIAAMQAPIPGTAYSVPIANNSFVPTGEVGLVGGSVAGNTPPISNRIATLIRGIRKIIATPGPPQARTPQQVASPSSSPARRGGPLSF